MSEENYPDQKYQPDGKRMQMAFSPPAWVRDKLVETAQQEHRSVSNVITIILLEHFNKPEGE